MAPSPCLAVGLNEGLSAGQRCHTVQLPPNRSGQVWGHTPEQRVAASTLRRYCFEIRLAIAHAEPRPYLSDRTPPDATMKRLDAPSA